MWVIPYGLRSGLESIELASSSLTNRSVFVSQSSGRPSLIEIQLTMQAELLRCAIHAGAIGVSGRGPSTSAGGADGAGGGALTDATGGVGGRLGAGSSPSSAQPNTLIDPARLFLAQEP